MENKLKEKFQATVNGKECTLCVTRPNQKQEDNAQKFYNRKFRELIDSKTIIRAKVDSIMREQNIWDDDKQKELEDLQKKLLDTELKLKKGGKEFKYLKDAKLAAFEMMKNRSKLLELVTIRSSIDALTAESQAEQYRFNYLVSICTVYDNDDETKGNPVFKDLEDYLEKSDQDYAITAANKLAFLLHNINELQSKLPENKFLMKYGFMNQDYRLVDAKGRLVNMEGKHIDETGRYIKWIDDKKFEYMDINGNKTDKDGEYLVEFEPFLNDDGTEVIEAVKSTKDSIEKELVAVK